MSLKKDIIENDTNTLLDLRFQTEFTTDLGDCLSLKTMVDGLNLTAEVKVQLLNDYLTDTRLCCVWVLLKFSRSNFYALELSKINVF